MRKPSVLFARTPTGRSDSFRGNASVFELKPKRRLQVEPDVPTIRCEVPILTAIARRELLGDVVATLLAASASARTNEAVNLAGPGSVAALQRLRGPGGDTSQCPAPAG